MSKLKEATAKAARALWKSLPIIIGIILLISLANALIPKEAVTKIFTQNAFFDSFIGSAIGSVLAGTPITSYILGGELLNQGVSLIAVTAFIVAWVTVGVVQFPAEAVLLGKKFAITRNITAFVMAILVAFATIALLSFV